MFIFTIASLNFALGVAVAVAVSHDWGDLRLGLSGLSWGWSRKGSPPAPEPPREAAISQPVLEPAANAEGQAPGIDLPEGWRERLAAFYVVPVTVLEAALHLVRLEDEVHRANWMTAEQGVRGGARHTDMEAAHSALSPLRSEASTWLGWARLFLEDLKSYRDHLGDGQACADELEERMLDQMACVEALREKHDAVLKETDPELAIRRFLRECSAAFEKSCRLRDFVLDQLARLLVARGGVADMPEPWQRDTATGYPNRLGLETMLADWARNDPSRKRLVSGAVIEIDRLGKLNERMGAQQSDQVIRAFAKLVEGVIRSDRGDRVARVAGPAIFVLLSDAGVAGAKAAAERIRQTVEAATFESRSEEFTLAANCAVCDYLFDDNAPELLARLQAGIVEAKRGGRNRTAIDEGQGPVLFDAQPIQVRAQTIKVGAA